jgi:hypothetical protein
MSLAEKQLYYGVISACSKAANTQPLERVNILGSVDASFSVSLKPRTYDIKITSALKRQLVAAQTEFKYKLSDLGIVPTRVRSSSLRGYTVYAISVVATISPTVIASTPQTKAPDPIKLEIVFIPRVGLLHILQS